MSSVPITGSTADSLSDSVRVAHSYDGRSPSLAVVEGIADLVGVDSSELADETGIVLYDYVNPDALNALVTEHPDVEVALSFTIDTYDVCIHRDEVVVRHAE